MDSVLCSFSLNNHHKGIVSRDFLPLFTQHWTWLGPLSKGINTLRFWLGLCCPIRILKGESSEIFTSSIFHHSNPPGPGPNGSISQEYNKVNWLINVELNLRSGHTIFSWVNLPRVSYPDVSISPGCNTQEESIFYGQVRAFFARCLEKIRISCWENSHADTFVSYWENLVPALLSHIDIVISKKFGCHQLPHLDKVKMWATYRSALLLEYWPCHIFKTKSGCRHDNLKLTKAGCRHFCLILRKSGCQHLCLIFTKSRCRNFCLILTKSGCRPYCLILRTKWWYETHTALIAEYWPLNIILIQTKRNRIRLWFLFHSRYIY